MCSFGIVHDFSHLGGGSILIVVDVKIEGVDAAVLVVDSDVFEGATV